MSSLSRDRSFSSARFTMRQ